MNQTKKNLKSVQSPEEVSADEVLMISVEELTTFEARGICMGDDPGDNND